MELPSPLCQFSIAAINDIDSFKNQSEPLAPTKEAQESFLKKIYEEALSHLENRRYLNAQLLFETIIQNQLCLKSQMQAAPDSGSMLQLRFLTFKNLAEAYLKQGSDYYKDALNCYLEAVSINGKDVVLWNRLGTLACTVGLCSVARKAFEKGLQCSPRHWSCMEKLAEVLVHIGDEKGCLSVVNRLLRFFPSHPRALHIRKTILNSSNLSAKRPQELGLVNPLGFDSLEPHHCSLGFPRKRKLEEGEDAERYVKKFQHQKIEIDIQEFSWSAVLHSLCDASRQKREIGKTADITDAVNSFVTEKDGGDHFISSFLANSHVSFLLKSEVSGSLDVTKENSRSPMREVEKICIGDTQALSNGSNGALQPCSQTSSLNSGLQESQLHTGELMDASDFDKVRVDEANDKVFLSVQGAEGKVDSFRSKDIPNDEEPQAVERRSTRLERLRTRRYDKNGDIENTPVKSWQIFKQLVEEFCTFCGKESHGHQEGRSSEYVLDHDFKNAGSCQKIAGCFVHTVKCRKNEDCADALGNLDVSKGEVEEVARFLREFSCNSGIFHIGNSVLERVILSDFNHQSIRPYLLELEKVTRVWVKDRKHFCSLFFAEVYMDEAVSSSKGLEIKQHLKDCDYHLCKLLEFQALHAFSPCVVTCQKVQDQSQEINKLIYPVHWSFWLRFHYVSARFWMLSGDLRRGNEEFQKCLSIFCVEEEADNPLVEVVLSHCKMDNKISAKKIERLFYEYHLEDLLRRSAAEVLEKGQFSELINLLAPILLPSDGAVDVMFSCISGSAMSHFSQELSGLEMLISACWNIRPPNYKIAFQCYYRRLEIFCRLTGILNSNITDIFVSPDLNISAPDIEQDQNKGKGTLKNFNMIWKELKVISNAAARVKEWMDESGNPIVFLMSTEVLGKIHQLLILMMGHFLAIINNRKHSSSMNVGFEEDIESSCLVDTAVAFCRIQLLQPCFTVEQQVGLLMTVHELLAECGLCCAGLNCEGGEGAFLKMAIKHLLALEISLKDNSSSRNQDTSRSHKLYGNADMKDNTQNELMEFAPDSCDRDGVQEVLKEKPVAKTKRKNDQSTMFQEQPIHSLSKNTFEFASSKSCKEAKKSILCVGAHQDVHTFKERSLELRRENALDQNFFCLYGLNLKGGVESNTQDGLTVHKNTSRGDFQTKEQCAAVLQYVLPYAKVCSRSCLMKLRKVLRAVRKQFPKPPAHFLEGNPIDSFLDDEEFDEELFYSLAVSARRTETLMYALQRGDRITYTIENDKDIILNYCNVGKSTSSNEQASGPISRKANSFVDVNTVANAPRNTDKIANETISDDLEPYDEVYANLYYLLSQVEDISASDKWPGFVLTNEGEDFVEQNASLFKFDLLYNPSRFDSWKRLASIYDEEVDLMLNDGSKNVNVLEWRKNAKFMSRVENSRRRSRRCLLMSLALTCSETEKSEMNEMLALVYYDALQNVVPSYDQRELVPVRNSSWILTCNNSFRHFESAFSYKSDWTHLLYIGKLCEKLGRPFDEAFSYYKKAIEINPAVVDPIYRLHCSRLKLLCRASYHDCEVLQVVARYCFEPSNTDIVNSKLSEISACMPFQQSSFDNESVRKESWNVLFKDCMLAMQMCIEGELKHFHKARFSLAQALKYRGCEYDLEKAKEELSFCFKSSRSPFIINMWELDGVVKKSKRKTTSSTSGKRLLDLGLPESSRKFITCVRKYLLVYLGLCEQTKDLPTLERAYTSLKSDKKFSLCLDDVASIALGKYIHTLVAIAGQSSAEGCTESFSVNILLEKIFNVFMEHGNSCLEAVALSLDGTGTSNESSEDLIYRYMHTYLQHLEDEGKIDTLESVNERIRKRFRNSKLSNAYSLNLCKHTCVAWCRALCFALSEITPLPCDSLLHPRENSNDTDQSMRFIIDLKEEKTDIVLYDSVASHSSSQALRTGNGGALKTSRRELHFVPIMQVPEENMDKAANLLKSTYIFYRECSSGPFPDCVDLYIKAPINVNAGMFSEVMNNFSSLGFPIGPAALDISTPKILLLWAFSLVHGRGCSVAEAVKYCEEQAKVIKQHPQT